MYRVTGITVYVRDVLSGSFRVRLLCILKPKKTFKNL